LVDKVESRHAELSSLGVCAHSVILASSCSVTIF
jgi:hypothetical protein